MHPPSWVASQHKRSKPRNKSRFKLMKILMLASSYYPKINGTTRAVRSLSVALSRNHDVHLMTRWRAHLPRSESYQRLRVTRIGYGKAFGESLLFAILLTIKTLRLCRERPDMIIHAHGTLPGVCA